MGLDMYLTGERYIRNHDRKRGEKKAELIELGYWRKHPDLHGFIVETLADDDDCKPIGCCWPTAPAPSCPAAGWPC